MQTIHLEKEKLIKHRIACQMPFANKGTCAFCGRAVDKAESYCDDVCKEEGRIIGGDCEICGLLTQEGKRFCSPECEGESKLLAKLDGWFPNADKDTGLLIMWEDNKTLVIELYDTASGETASKYLEELLLISRKFKYQA